MYYALGLMIDIVVLRSHRCRREMDTRNDTTLGVMDFIQFQISKTDQKSVSFSCKSSKTEKRLPMKALSRFRKECNVPAKKEHNKSKKR